MPSHIFLRSSDHLIPSGPILQHTSNAKNIIPSEATFDVISVDLLLVPFVVCWPWSPGPKCLREPHSHVRRIVYIVASIHKHSKYVYLENTDIQEIYQHTKFIIHIFIKGIPLFVKDYVKGSIYVTLLNIVSLPYVN